MLVCKHPLTEARGRPQWRKLGHQSHGQGLGFARLVCLHVGTEHVCPACTVWNDLLELQNLVSL